MNHTYGASGVTICFHWFFYHFGWVSELRIDSLKRWTRRDALWHCQVGTWRNVPWIPMIFCLKTWDVYRDFPRCSMISLWCSKGCLFGYAPVSGTPIDASLGTLVAFWNDFTWGTWGSVFHLFWLKLAVSATQLVVSPMLWELQGES